jgi:hypothetical protein
MIFWDGSRGTTCGTSNRPSVRAVQNISKKSRLRTFANNLNSENFVINHITSEREKRRATKNGAGVRDKHEPNGGTFSTWAADGGERALRSRSTRARLRVALLTLILGAMMVPGAAAAGAAGSVTKTQSGLVASDSMTTGNLASWTLGGSASSYDYYENSQGLYIGVQSPSSGTWVNYYAGSPSVNAEVFNANITIPYTSVADGVVNPGFYVEGSNYSAIIGCQPYADNTGYYWELQTTANAGDTWKTLYISPPSSLPQTEDCTIVTNGSNYLEVYLGGTVIFSSTSMSLDMPTPFRAFLQVDSSSGSMRYGVFENYYATTSEDVTVTGAPSGDTLQLVGPTGSVLASATVGSGGTATMPVAMYAMPLNADVEVLDSSGHVVASTSGPVQVYGGDVYSVTAPTQDPTTTSVTPNPATTTVGSPVTFEATVRDTSSSPSSPTGDVTWSDGGAGGSFSPATCTLTTAGSSSSSCQTTYTPPSQAGSVSITAGYPGDSTHSTSSGASSLTVDTATQYSIAKQSSGLIDFDPLDNVTMSQQQLQSSQKYWSYGGSAAYYGAPYSFDEDGQGLHVGVQAPASGQYAGFYAVTPDTHGEAFHANLTLPTSTTAQGVYNVGLYVQTDNGSIDYVTCIGQTSSAGAQWSVWSATGNSTTAKTITELWADLAPNQPLSQSCTIVTNGRNYVSIYLDNSNVYANDKLNLQMPSPFNAFLEVESSYSGQMLTGTFTDFYATTGGNVTVNGLPTGASHAQLDSPSGAVLASSQASSGTATFDIAGYTFPLSASIVVKDSSGVTLVSSSVLPLWGGDSYSVSSSPSNTTTTTSTTTNSTGITLMGVQTASGNLSSSPYEITLADFNAGTGSDRLLVVGVEADNESVASVTFGGAPLTLAVQSFNNDDSEFWYLTAPTGTGNIVVTMAGPTSVVVGAYSFSGVDQASPIATTTTAHGTSPSSPSVTITTQYPNSWVLDSPSIFGDVTLGSPSCTQGWDVNIPNAITGASSSTIAKSPGPVTCSWTASGGGDLWDDVAIEIRA